MSHPSESVKEEEEGMIYQVLIFSGIYSFFIVAVSFGPSEKPKCKEPESTFLQ